MRTILRHITHARNIRITARSVLCVKCRIGDVDEQLRQIHIAVQVLKKYEVRLIKTEGNLSFRIFRSIISSRKSDALPI